MLEKLKPCPHCGCTHFRFEIGTSQVVCGTVNCQLKGPRDKTHSGTVDAWNALPRHLRWTNESPTEQGLYWYRETKNIRGRIVSVYKTGRQCYMTPLDEDIF